LKSGEIQAAIQLSHPDGTHFDSISIGYEGTNGQLANLDLINSAVHIAGAQVRVPVTVQGVENNVDSYERRLRTLFKGMVQQGLGLSSGSGTFGRYKIDAITLKAVGGEGNHDDIAFGRSLSQIFIPYRMLKMSCRVIESLCRSLNNLLEHLHQSFFFYFLLSPTGKTLGEPGRFVSIGTYLPAAMVLAASFTITAITLWMQSSVVLLLTEKEKLSSSHVPHRRSTSIGFPLGVVAVLHGMGFLVLASFNWIQRASIPLSTVAKSYPNLLTISKSISVFTFVVRVVELATPLTLRQAQFSRLIPTTTSNESSNSLLIKSLSLLALGICLSTLSTLNFSLGIFIGVLCSPLAFLRPVSNLSNRGIWVTGLAIVAMQLISPLNWFHLVAKLQFGEHIIDLAKMYRFAWKLWGAWTPLVWWCVWWPAWLAGLVVLLSPA
jgi:GPI-anchor transamidase subunit GAA1